jgi:hypothetical protein
MQRICDVANLKLAYGSIDRNRGLRRIARCSRDDGVETGINRSLTVIALQVAEKHADRLQSRVSLPDRATHFQMHSSAAAECR